MKHIRQIDRFLARAEEILLASVLSLMILLSFSQVILRNVFHGGILWADVFLRQMVLWVGFLGASLAAREGRHISIDFIPHVFSQVWLKRARIFVHIAAGIISALLAWAALKFLWSEMESESILFLNIPVWTFQTILPVSFTLIAIRFLIHALEGILSSGSSK
ncbi:MAG: TRAP transporter small permease [Nitrospinales bacterium]